MEPEACDPDCLEDFVPCEALPHKCFVGHGVFSECRKCGSTIEAGIMYYGCRPDGVADDGSFENHGWAAACQEVSFHHFKGSCEPEISDVEDLQQASTFPGYISRSWAKLAVNPQQALPGSDRGVTWSMYRAVQEQNAVSRKF